MGGILIKECPVCRKSFDGLSVQKYCSGRCKKTFENSQRSAPSKRKGKSHGLPPVLITCPSDLNEMAGAYWRKVAPVLADRGHLNVLSEDSFKELCNLYSQLQKINRMIDEAARSGDETVSKSGGLLEVDEKRDSILPLFGGPGSGSKIVQESKLSSLKRQYSKGFLEYCKQFYMTPFSNRGNFGLPDDQEKDPTEEFLK